MARKKKKALKIAIIITILVLILLLTVLLLLNKNFENKEQTDLEKANIKYLESTNQKIVEDLSEKSEQQRMQYYCASFFKLIDNNKYEEAYKLLYSEYKENFFPTFNNFKRYFEEYFPQDFGLLYSNIERLGDIYVLTVKLTDTVNGSYGHNFDLYVVIQENKLNDYVISFSRNSAVDNEEV